MTLGELLSIVTQRLGAARLHYGHGTHNAREEAAYLVFGGLRLAFDTPPELQLGKRQVERVEALVRRRIAERIPAAYLVNRAWLGEVEFYVDRRTIVPRSFIAELLRQPRDLKPWLPRSLRRVLDLCTGSGCLAVVAALAFPRARVDATDLSPGALQVARLNVAKHGLTSRVRLIRSNLFDALPGERYELIVTNPPYVTTASMRRLPAEYRHEPGLALAGGPAGLDLVATILSQAAHHLSRRGLLVCEIGHNRRALERAYPRTPFVWPETSTGAGHVFMLPREDLPSGLPSGRARTGGAYGKRSTPAPARR